MPFTRLVQSIWRDKPWQRGMEGLAEYCGKHLLEHGCIDRLSLGARVWDPRDPTCPGEIRVRLAPLGVVVIEAFFMEAPTVTYSTKVPMDQFKKEDVHEIARELAGNVLSALMQRASEESAKDEQDQRTAEDGR